MPAYYDSIPEHLREWAVKQSVFFTASAPLHGRHINVSPKGLPSTSLRILSPKRVAYLDSTGSGCETIAHTYEGGNGRVTLMFCSFGTGPRILRFFCNASVVEYTQREAFASMLAQMDCNLGEDSAVRAVIVLDVWKVQTSCGYGVPVFTLAHDKQPAEAQGRPPTPPSDDQPWQDRPTLYNWGGTQVRNGALAAYQAKWNAYSLDGLPGLRSAVVGKGKNVRSEVARAWARRVMSMQRMGMLIGFVMGVMCTLFAVWVAGLHSESGCVDTGRIRSGKGGWDWYQRMRGEL